MSLSLPIKIFSFIQRWQTPAVWTYHPFIYEAVDITKCDKLIYHCVDDLAAVPGINPEGLRNSEKKLVKDCHIIFTTAPNLQLLISRWAPNKTFYFSNVADLKMFAKARNELKHQPEPADIMNIPKPRIAYVGVLTDYKVSFNLLKDIAIDFPQLHWVLIGDEREGQQNAILSEIKGLPNVHLLGHKPYRQIPAYLSALDIVTLPTLINDYTKSMFPMKFFEYLASGTPVIATEIPALQEFSHLHFRVKSNEEFKEAVRQILKDKPQPIDFVKFNDYDWETRMDKMLSKIQELDSNSL